MAQHALDSTQQGRHFRVLFSLWMYALVARLLIAVIGWATPIDVQAGAWETANALLIIPLAIGGIGSAVSYIRGETAHKRRLAENAVSEGRPATEEPVSAGRTTASFFGDVARFQVYAVIPCCLIFFGSRQLLLTPLGEIVGSLVAAGATLAWVPVMFWILNKRVGASTTAS